MSRRSRTGYLTLLALLAGPTFVAASCDNALSMGETGGPPSSTGDACKVDECKGPAPKSATYTCKDGSLAGPECARSSAGVCAWSVRTCPEENTTPPQFQCKDGSKVTQAQVCNATKDCIDGSDEVNCSPGVFYCADKTTKIDASLVCNAKKECPDGSDESNCAPSVFYCADKTTKIDAALVCKQKKECPDGSDESNCAPSVFYL
jgi:hypothetical protein